MINNMFIPIPYIIGSVTALIVIGFVIGAYGSRFITRVEFKEAIDRFHERIDELVVKINDLAVKVAEINGVKN